MVNRVRGEAVLKLGDKQVSVALGLGALAQLEDAFGVENFEEALDFSKLSAKRLHTFVRAVLQGNGIDPRDHADAIDRMSIPDFMSFLGDLMAASGLSERSAEAAPEGDAAPLAGKRAGKRG